MKNKKKKSFVSRCPLAIMLILSVLIVTAIAVIGMAAGWYKVSWGLNEPALNVVMLNQKPDGETKETTIASSTEAKATEKATKETEETTEAIETSKPVIIIESTSAKTDSPEDPQTTEAISSAEQAESSTEEATTEAENTTASPAVSGRVNLPMNYSDRAPCEVRSEYYDDPQKSPENKTYDYVYGDETYFQDALFIGDSRIQGIYYYNNGKIPADYAYLEGVSLFKCKTMSFNLSSTGGEYLLSDILAMKSYKKIYLMFGLNELGDHTSKEYGEYFQNVCQWVQAQAPQAVITILGSMPISTDKSNNMDISTWRNNDNINSRNYWAAVYACDGTDVFYLNNNLPEFVDAYGGLSPDVSNDGIHLAAERYDIWVEYIRSHCLNANMWQ